MTRKKLNAENLKTQLWEVLLDVQEDKVKAKTANAIVSAARGIVSTIKVEMQIQTTAETLSSKVRKFTD